LQEAIKYDIEVADFPALMNNQLASMWKQSIYAASLAYQWWQ